MYEGYLSLYLYANNRVLLSLSAWMPRRFFGWHDRYNDTRTVYRGYGLSGWNRVRFPEWNGPTGLL